MPLTRANLKAKVSNISLKPLLSNGFMLCRDKVTCYRVRGDFVDVVSIQVGRSLGSLYLHSFINLLVNPLANHLSSYKVGFRLDRNPINGRAWLAPEDDESDIELLLQDIASMASTQSIEFFDSINCYKEYLGKIHSDPNKALFDYEEIICLSKLGQYDDAITLCEQNILRVKEDEEFTKAEINERVRFLDILLASSKQEEIPKEFDVWKEDTLKKIESRAL
ncbi:hypothetical protein [Kangiella aquimarina]|uniref:Uncharacterized protein n=1 Tax=Kangiella aquimarina TaxID=261965 RepID=A0ABZ0X1M3_9GAMM|nr:hypothetical protein [Kangiella aquimarina]WQG84488.1 hypothetical protein SR900_08420 [Kangiella aquimarina]